MTPFEAHILIQQGSPSNSLSSMRTTNALEEALKSQRLNPNGTFKRESFLSTAIKRNSPNLLRLLLENGASPDLKSYENGRWETPLMTAIRYKSLSCVKTLVEYGGNVRRTNFYGADAIFQAVYENAFSILEYLLEELHHPNRSGTDRRRQEERNETPRKPIVIQKVATTKEEETSCSARGRVLNIKESSHYKEPVKEEDDYDHMLCPFYYALNNATAYPCKRESLILLLQNYFKCKCVQEMANCCCSYPSSNSDFYLENGNLGVLECLAALDSVLPEENLLFQHENARVSCTTPSAQIDRDPEVLERELNDHYKRANAIFASGDDDYENYMKFPHHQGNEKLCAYKIFRIKGKCHTIKENEASSSSSTSSRNSERPSPAASYLALVGPLKLSCIVREVIRNQIILRCTYTYTFPRNANFDTCAVAPSPPSSLSASSEPPGVYDNYGGKRNLLELKGGEECQQRNFRKCLDTLMLPAPLTRYILYDNIKRKGMHALVEEQMKVSNIKLIKRDLMLNVNYFAFYIF